MNLEEKTNILSARLLQLNTDYTSAQSERLKKQAGYESIRDGQVAATLAAGQGEALRKLAEHVNDAKEQVAQARSFFYGANHPEARRAQAGLDQAQNAHSPRPSRKSCSRVEIEFRESASAGNRWPPEAVAAAKREFDAMNAHSFEYQSIKREADADKSLYDELVRKIKEAGINAGFQNSSIRIADPARPPLKPVFPNVPLNALLAFLFSGLVGVGGAVLADALDKTVRDPEQAQRTLRTEVIGSLPAVESAGQVTGESARGRMLKTIRPALAKAFAPLRNSILLGNFDRRYRSLLVTSAALGEGKTTTSCQFGCRYTQSRIGELF